MDLWLLGKWLDLKILEVFLSNLNDSMILWLMPYCAQPNEFCFLTLQFLSPSVFFSMWLLYIGLFYYTNLKLREKALQFAPILFFFLSSLQMNKKNPLNQQKINKTPNKQLPKSKQTKTPNKTKPTKTNQKPKIKLQSPALPFSLSSFVLGQYNGSH